MILKALHESYKNHIGFAIVRASDEDWQTPTFSRVRATVLSSGPERVKPSVGANFEACAGALLQRE